MYRIRNLSVGSLLLLALLSSCECDTSPGSSVADESIEAADLVFTGGKISTVDPTLGEQQAIAILGYRVLAVADDVTIAKHVGPNTQVIELQGRRVVPGFIEGHGHYLSFGQAQQILDLNTAEWWRKTTTF